jgi:hypothetical protein
VEESFWKRFWTFRLTDYSWWWGLEAVTKVAVKILPHVTLIHVALLQFKGIFSYKCFFHVQGSESRVSFKISVNFYQNSWITIIYIFSITNILNSKTKICTCKIWSREYSTSFRDQNPSCSFRVLVLRYICFIQLKLCNINTWQRYVKTHYWRIAWGMSNLQISATTDCNNLCYKLWSWVQQHNQEHTLDNKK